MENKPEQGLFFNTRIQYTVFNIPCALIREPKGEKV